jgi:hypothetical protein
MSDELRRVLAKTLTAMGLVMLGGCFLRWVVWKRDQLHPPDPHPEVLWMLGFVGLTLLAGAVSLVFRLWWRGFQPESETPHGDPEQR